MDRTTVEAPALLASDEPSVPESAREEPGVFLDKVALVAPTLLYVFDLRTLRNVWSNRSITAHLGYEPEAVRAMGSDLLDRIMHPDDRPVYDRHYERLLALEEGEVARLECRMRHRDGTWRRMVFEETPYLVENGSVAQIVGSGRDVTEAYAERERDALLARELNHRVKNLFAIVPAILDLSMRGTSDPAQLRESVRLRMAALARAHTLTIAASSLEEGVLLEAMVEAVLEPYGDRSDRVVVSGPPVRLASRGGSAVGLALHELATNAIKYGALSGERGSVRIAWVVDREESAQGRTGTLTILWEETGGPKISGEPAKRGFGTRLIDALVTSQGGAVRREWRHHGMLVEIEMPLYRVGAEPKFPEGMAG